MNLHVGTSGYSYKEWKGNFYPEKIPAKGMLEFYATKLPAVEINNTFYRLPKAEVLEGWAQQTPETFRFAVKASRRITHMKRLNEVGEETEYLLRTVRTLGPRLGCVLFQLPPNMKKNMERLETFVAELPADVKCVFEFRHESWFDDEVMECLRAKDVALCLAETDDEPAPETQAAEGWGYVRLRKTAYTDAEVRAWAKRLKGMGWGEGFVFFKHEDAGTGPALAGRLMEVMG